MNINIIIPIRPSEEGKSRLAGAMNPDARALLIERMFRHVLIVALDFAGPTRCHVVSRSPLFLGLAKKSGANLVHETGFGLNESLTEAASGVSPDLPVLAMHADLPFLTAGNLADLARTLRDADVIAASDHAGLGTNALLLRRPGLIPYAFGENSLARHRALAESNGLRFAQVTSPGLAMDIDEPADLALLSDEMLSSVCGPDRERQPRREACH